MASFVDDFKIDGVTGVSGEFSDEFIKSVLPGAACEFEQTYRARNLLKFIGEVYKRHKNDYGKRSRLDCNVRVYYVDGVGPVFTIDSGGKVYGICPSMESPLGMVCDGVETGTGASDKSAGIGNV